ncbi:penicillin-binding transpeptidase domain-containing protein [Streptomyces sp. TRM 70351]|uniref:penicillin-binding transpeptidase domain-containing protein n=1 Tax=Streptomyces sp. TRM 70351 TaxID=3116552 RepID=UPI002E7AE89A|nr:penicillin-binding transpeptidase domain-containing protein [Streptomyces sp. TRM 70351]MEE1929458.1 penicillin-binding transpeptidase domain-containing protein [Streptomyces sp. TRM 70351]
MRDGQKMAVIGAVCAAAVGAAGFGAYAFVGGEGTQSGNDPGVLRTSQDDSKPGAAPTGPPSATEVRTAAGAFLTAWESGDTAEAAALTDDETAAAKALAAFTKDAGVTAVDLTEGTPAGAEVPFDVTASITHQEQTASLAYTSGLTVVRGADGEPVVDWEPAVLHPELAEGDTLVTDAAGDPEVVTVDRDGQELTAKEYPELAAVLADVTRRYTDSAGGEPGIVTRVVGADGKDKKVLKKLTEGTPGTVRTTLDAGLQKAAQAALEGKAKGSAVAIRPSTGEILAVASTPAGGFNSALRGSLAPGSTFKVVSASMLIEKGLASADAPHPCPKFFTHGGWKFQNLDEFEIQGGTFRQSFARSCNTAFISQAPELSDDDLTQQARDLFGIGLTWSVGTGTFDGAVPVQSDAQMAASLIGQGGVRANPLIMASVAATVKAGAFHQPVIVPQDVDGRALATAPRPMSPALAEELRSLMRTTATSGTAQEAMASVGGDKGGKTGSAEVDAQELPNAWFIGFSDDLAAAALIPASGHGGTNAGPVVAEILNAG